MEAARHLRVVDGDGVVHESCPNCAALEDQVAGAEKDIRAWRARWSDLKRDKEGEARKDPLWPEATDLFRFYCRLTGKPDRPRKLTWTAERFELVQPFLKKYGVAMCQRAIVGRVTDHFTARRANGSTVHYHEWERIFGAMGRGQTAASNFEESCKRAPGDWRERVERMEAAA